MPNSDRLITLATRGSALALAQANLILSQCRAAFPGLQFELKIVKTTGDKLQTASLAQEGQSLPKGLFTKELEVALLNRQADLAVHSLKDLPTELPTGLKLGAVAERADVRDVLIYRGEQLPRGEEPEAGSPGLAKKASGQRGFKAGLRISDLPKGAAVATSSTRRRAQLLVQNPTLRAPDIRGNVATRMQKIAQNPELDATVLALAGITRLNFRVAPDSKLTGEAVPDGLLASVLDIEVMLPCVGQGAIGIEIREDDERVASICEQLNHFDTLQCVTAERAFLAAMGGGCQSPVAAYAQVVGRELHLQAISFADGPMRRAQSTRPIEEPTELGKAIAAQLKG